MTISEAIELISRSGNQAISAAAEDLGDFGKLRHDKTGLEIFLAHNIAVVSVSRGIGRKMEFLVSSCPPYLSYLDGQRVQKNKNSVARMFTRSPAYARLLRSRNKDIVRTWDLVKNNKLEIPMRLEWKILRWVGLNGGNIENMAMATQEILDRGKAEGK